MVRVCVAWKRLQVKVSGMNEWMIEQALTWAFMLCVVISVPPGQVLSLLYQHHLESLFSASAQYSPWLWQTKSLPEGLLALCLKISSVSLEPACLELPALSWAQHKQHILGECYAHAISKKEKWDAGSVVRWLFFSFPWTNIWQEASKGRKVIWAHDLWQGRHGDKSA